MNFTDFGLNPQLLEGIQAMNFENPTPVQQKVIPEIMAGHDVVACAQTGTGKTAAFLLPVINNIITLPQNNFVKALVIVPTRELAMQITEQIDGFGYFTQVSSLAVYGGGDGQLFESEKSALKKGVDIVVCTPGRMISHLTMGFANFEKIKFLILDEADRMLDMGFHDDIMKIISNLPAHRQSLLFSATMPPKIRTLTKKLLNNAREINIEIARPPEKIRQEAYYVTENMKSSLIRQLINDPDLKSIVVFCGTKSKVKELRTDLRKMEKNIEEIHSDLEQKERTEVMNRFKNRQVRVLIATDIISRGIDVEDIDMIINFNVPGDAEDYVHRIGRTARAESDGRAVTLIGESEHGKFSVIEKLIGQAVKKIDLPGLTNATTHKEVPESRHRKQQTRYNTPGKKKRFVKRSYENRQPQNKKRD